MHTARSLTVCQSRSIWGVCMSCTLPCHACPLPATHAPLATHTPPCGQNHRRLWKYNLAPTSLRAVMITKVTLVIYSSGQGRYSRISDVIVAWWDVEEETTSLWVRIKVQRVIIRQSILQCLCLICLWSTAATLLFHRHLRTTSNYSECRLVHSAGPSSPVVEREEECKVVRWGKRWLLKATTYIRGCCPHTGPSFRIRHWPWVAPAAHFQTNLPSELITVPPLPRSSHVRTFTYPENG